MATISHVQFVKKKKHRRKNEKKNFPDHNPADEGLDHNLRTGTEKDLDESYILKQEAMNNRGEDNEDIPNEAD